MFRRLNDALIQYRAARTSGDKRGLLIISSGGIGDSILFSLMIERFMALVGEDDPVTLVVRTESLGVGFLFPSRVNIIGVDYRRFIRDGTYKRQVCADLRALNVQIAISSDHLRLPTVDDVMVMATGAAQNFALRPRTWPKHDRALAQHEAWYTRWIEPDPAPAHRLIRWWELANALTGESPPPPKVAFAADRLPVPAQAARPYIVLHPFSAMAEREAAPDVFIAIADAYAKTHDIVVTAGPRDLARAPRHQPLADMPGVSVDTSSFKEKAALLRGAALVVSVDTSIMHLAVGVGAPTLCLASAAHIVDSVPYDSRMMPENAHFMVPEVDCAGCLGQCIHPLESGRYKCLGQITAAASVARCQSLLAAHAAGA
jgi:ADP-heptose:LPS heptosyltransferase